MEVTATLAPKDPDVQATYSIDFRAELIQEVQRNTDYVLGAIVKAQRNTGFFYECTTAGQSGNSYPIWPRAAGEVVTDTRRGSVGWTCRHPDDVSYPAIQSAVWTLPAAMTLVSQSESNGIAHITLSGGVDGEDYDITCRMTPSSGDPVDRTVTIPVRQQ